MFKLNVKITNGWDTFFIIVDDKRGIFKISVYICSLLVSLLNYSYSQ